MSKRHDSPYHPDYDCAAPEKAKRTAEDIKLNPGTPCPKCGDEGLGDVIPPELNKDECYGPQGRRFGTHTGIEDPMVYDGIAWWECGGCGHIWKRFSWVPEYKG